MNWDLDPSACLQPTDFVNADHPAIVDGAGRLDLARRTPVERAVRLFEFMRDDVEYEFAAKLKREEYVASYVLAEGKGFCVQKSVLLCALARAAAVPTALVMSDLRDHTLGPRVVEAMGTDVMVYHGLAAFHLDGRWLRVDAALSPGLVRRKGYRLVEFDGETEALLSPTTEAGEPHCEYLQWRGAYADLPYEAMIATFASVYQHADFAKLARLMP